MSLIIARHLVYIRLRYQLRILLPQSRVIKVATERKGPKGMVSLRPFFFTAIKATATTPPKMAAVIKATNTRGKPVAKPIKAASLTSPHPIPPREASAIRENIAKLMPPPMAEVAMPGIFPGVSHGWGRNKARSKATIIPG